MKQLTAKDLVVGNKYVPHSKSWNEDESLEDSVAWQKAQAKGQPYLYYVGVDEDWGHSPIPMFWYEMDEDSGDYFLPSDVTPYIEPSAEAKQYEAPATLSEFGSDERLINRDGTCPVTGTPCDDECCPVGAECNASSDNIQDCDPIQSTDPKDFLPFNLEEALKSPERVVYRDGEKPLEWYHLKGSQEAGRKIVSVTPRGNPRSHFIDGCWNVGRPDKYDLFLLPLPKTTYWINVMEEEFSGVMYITGPWKSEAEAFQQIVMPDKCIKTITFEI